VRPSSRQAAKLQYPNLKITEPNSSRDRVVRRHRVAAGRAPVAHRDGPNPGIQSGWLLGG
jgi:hypothetical protein